MLDELRQNRTEYFAKGLEKCTFLSTLLGKFVKNLDDYGCPKIQRLNTDWLCTSYPYRHKINIHWAERKEIAFFTNIINHYTTKWKKKLIISSLSRE